MQNVRTKREKEVERIEGTDGGEEKKEPETREKISFLTGGVLGVLFWKVVAPTAGSSFFIQEMSQRQTHQAPEVSFPDFPPPPPTPPPPPVSTSPLAAAPFLLMLDSARQTHRCD